MQNTLPQTGFIRLPQVLQLYPVSKSTLWLRVKEGRFPTPVKLSERVTAWRVADVHDFLDKLAN
jgi:predicted DNA-binding transcriptional regulator AlpA